MRNIDFLPDAFRQACRRRTSRIRRLWLGGMVLCVLIGWLGVDELRLRRARQYVDYLAVQNETVQAGLQHLARLQAEQMALLDKHRLLQELQPPASSVATVFRIAQLLPEHVALKQLQMTCRPAPVVELPAAKAPGPKTAEPRPVLPRVALWGIALSQVDIAVLVGQLSGCREFANVRLDYSKAADLESRRVQEFRVTFDVLTQAAATQAASGA